MPYYGSCKRVFMAGTGLYYIHDILLYAMLFIISVHYIQVVLTFTYNSFYTIYMLYILYFEVCNISYILFCILLQLWTS